MCFTVKLSRTARPAAKKAVEVGADNIFTIKKAKFAPVNRALVSEGANTCLLVALNAGKNNCLLHLAPEQQPVWAIKEGLEKCIDTLAEKCGNVHQKITAFLFGGKELIEGDSESAASFDVYNTAADSLDELEIPFTMICGKKDGMTPDNIYTINDNATIWNHSLKNLNLPKDATQDEIAEELSKRYQFVEIHPEVPVEIIDKFNPKTQHLSDKTLK